MNDVRSSLLNAVIEATTDGILVVNSAGQIVHYNRQFLTMWRIPDSVMAGQDDKRALTFVLEQLKDPDEFLAKVQELYGNPTAESFDVLHFKDERVFERYSKVPIVDGSSVGRVWSFRDVTARKRAEADRSDLILKLKEAVALRDEFLSVASHELKTPLTSLTMQIQLIQQLFEQGTLGTLSRENSSELFRLSRAQLQRFTILINDLLDASRITAGCFSLSIQSTDISILIREVIHRFQVEFERAGSPIGVHLDSQLKGQLDPSRIEQVVVNLLSNAVKYGAGKPIEVTGRMSGKKMILSVRDHGIGISKKDHARIFERFERAAPVKNFGGLGLGLYITRKIVEAHGGSIHLESELGKGSTFTVELPTAG